MSKYAVTIYQDEEGWYVAECPVIPGCMSQGRTEEEALANIREAIQLCLEVRRCWAIPDPDCLRYVRDLAKWPDLRSLVLVEYERHTGERVITQRRYYISSLVGNARQILNAVRYHWSIENNLHWVLDVAFNEDRSRVRTDNAPENFALLRHIAINLAKQDKVTKIGVKGKRLKAGWDEKHLGVQQDLIDAPCDRLGLRLWGGFLNIRRQPASANCLCRTP